MTRRWIRFRVRYEGALRGQRVVRAVDVADPCGAALPLARPDTWVSRTSQRENRPSAGSTGMDSRSMFAGWPKGERGDPRSVVCGEFVSGMASWLKLDRAVLNIKMLVKAVGECIQNPGATAISEDFVSHHYVHRQHRDA